VLKESLYAYTVYAAALTPVILAAFFWRRATAWGAVTSIAAGTIVTVVWDKSFVQQHLPAGLAAQDAIMPALVISVVGLGVVSFLTKRPTERQLRPFEE
jgi:SSS family solute:Na+ symporter/sodium/proline symporter